MTDSLPVLPFITIMDLFAFLSFGFVLLVTIQHAVIPQEEEELDRVLFWVFLAVWAMVQVGFAIYCPIIMAKERKKLTMNTPQLTEYMHEEGVPSVHKFETQPEHVEAIKRHEWISLISAVE